MTMEQFLDAAELSQALDESLSLHRQGILLLLGHLRGCAVGCLRAA